MEVGRERVVVVGGSGEEQKRIFCSNQYLLFLHVVFYLSGRHTAQLFSLFIVDRMLTTEKERKNLIVLVCTRLGKVENRLTEFFLVGLQLLLHPSFLFELITDHHHPVQLKLPL